MGGSWVFIRKSPNNIISYYFSESCEACRNQNSVLRLNESTEFSSHQKFIKKSPSGNLLAIVVNSNRSYPFILNLYTVNKSNGGLTFLGSWSDELAKRFPGAAVSLANYGNLEFSSNDSLLYFTLNGSFSGTGDSNFVIKARPFNTSSWQILRQTVNFGIIGNYKDVKLFNNRKMYLSYLDLVNRVIVFDRIEEPNKLGSTTISQRVMVLNHRTYSGIANQFGISPYNYIAIDHSTSYDCIAHVRFSDSSDYSLDGTYADFYVETKPGSDTFNLYRNPTQLDFEKNGKYALRVVLRSQQGMYKEIYLDTIDIDIPAKPEPNFTAKDSIYCAYTPIDFSNTSKFEQFNPLRAGKYVWTYGDGASLTTESDTSTFHTYTSPGLYTVSLFFSNGYCDSTLVKNQYIEINEAPQPGFSLSDTFGCAPGTVILFDSITKNVSIKQYQVGDSIITLNLKQRETILEFTTPGTYKIKQILYGGNGCITQSDSAEITLIKGFSSDQVSNIQNVSYLNNNEIQVDWERVNSAAQYTLLRTFVSTQTLGTYTFLSITDPIEKPGLYKYSIVALDSCGRSTSTGMIGQPVFLSGSISADFETAILSFTPYVGWNDTSITYSILTKDSFGYWVTLMKTGKSGTYTIQPFLVPNQTERCFRIKAENGDHISYSNEICLNYPALVFVPNAFSPNGDGLNDNFKPVTFGIENYYFSVFNRWGELIYKSSEENYPVWYGTKIPSGLYTIILVAIDTDGVQSIYNKQVLLIR